MTTVHPGLAVEPIAADDEVALRGWLDVETAALAVDRPYDPPPCRQERHVSLTMPCPGSRTLAWLARAGDDVVGYARLELPILDNLDNAHAGICVAPRHRRRGIGTALAEHLLARARAEGRARVSSQVCESPGAGAAFAARSGAVRALAEQRRRLTLPPAEAVLALPARSVAAGYRVVQWLGATPDEHVDALAYLTGRMSTDAPFDGLHVEPTRYDAARIRAVEVARAARGREIATTGAVHAAAGRLVAFTDIEIRPSAPTFGWQCDTLVDPAHRGHRLGMLIKLANLELARREFPLLRSVTTWNADSNPYMVSINEAMGFRPLDAWVEWQLELGTRTGGTGPISAAAAGR